MERKGRMLETEYVSSVAPDAVRVKMSDPDRVLQLFRLGLKLSAFSFLFAYLVLAFFRIRYPFELEWIESGTANHVLRVLSGKKLYAEPSVEFVAWLLTPLYFYVSAVAARVFGMGFWPLRLISFLSSLGSFFIVFQFVRRETKDVFPALLAVGLLAATFPLTNSIFDRARVDSLFLFLLLAGMYITRYRVSATSCVVAALLFSLSFLTKQTALVITIPIVFYHILLNRRHALLFTAAWAGTLGVSTLVLNWIHEGWYVYYIYSMPSQHELKKVMFVDFWRVDLLSHLPVACIVSAIYLFMRLLHPAERKNWFYLCMSGGLIGGAWFSRLHSGGDVNGLASAYVAISILFGLAFHDAVFFLQRRTASKRKILEGIVYAGCFLQFVLLVYNPMRLAPTRADLEAGRKLVDMIAQVEGEVFLPYHNYLPALAGKKTYANAMALYDVFRSYDGEAKTAVVADMREAIRDKRFQTIILDQGYFLKPWLEETGSKGYRIPGYCMEKSPLFDDPSVFWPIAGWRTRPEIVYHACPNSDG